LILRREANCLPLVSGGNGEGNLPLPQQPVGILIHASLPLAMQIVEIDLHDGGDKRLDMLRHLCTLITGE
jgi:hypothetical protein